MFIKQVSVFLCPKNEIGDTDFLRGALEGARFADYQGETELTAKGFLPPSQHVDDLVLRSRGVARFCLVEKNKIIPAQVVNTALEERIEEIRDGQGRNVGRKERKDLKDEIMFDLSRQAFSNRRSFDFFYDEARRLLYVGTGNANKAAEAVEFLRAAMEGLHALPLSTALDPVSVYTQWIIDGEAPDPFNLGENCVLRGIGEDNSIVKVDNCPLESPDIQEHINNNRVVKEIGLVHSDRTSFTISENFSLKRLKLLDVEEDGKEEASDPVAAALVEQELLVGVLSGVYMDLVEALGGPAD